ncbi:MAG: succinate--CoA ligase subunit alpha [Anaerolineaceae bacterium]|nr:succinate--CoA ligase subunit alpha [Anaerolineaceae bacterium]
MSILADQNTRILVQGITGREASTFVLESRQYGAQIVAGVTPGKGGMFTHGVPVFDTVEGALKAEPCDATLISVPARFVKDAAFEAMDNDLRLIVIITENIPLQDVVSILEKARNHDARVVGPNSLGVISPGKTRIGMGGGKAEDVRRAYKPGPVGVISRSGGMMTEISNLLTQNGIGQSTCVSIGGDPIIGSTFLDLLPLYEADPDTKALVLFCEPGGVMEERLAEHLVAHPSRLHIFAFVAGRFADRMQGQRFGHAGAIVEGTRGSPSGKMEILSKAGVHVVQKLSQLPLAIQEEISMED